MKAGYQAVGRVVALHRFPVKSMGGEDVEQVHLGWHGIEGDRRHAFVRSGDLSGLPWLSAREMPRLVAYRAAYQDPADPRRASISVTTPAGPTLPLESPQVRHNVAEAWGAPVHLMQLHRGAFDSMNVSLITTRSVQSIADHFERPLEIERFRANIVIDSDADRAFPEERWVGELLVFGERSDAGRVRVNRRDKRCSVVSLNPITGEQDLPVHKAVIEGRKNQLGVYGSTERAGAIAVGDTVYLRR